MSRKYICSEVLAEWFADFEEEKGNWVITEIIENLFNALADTNEMMKDCGEDEKERLQTINGGIVSALTDLRRLMKEVSAQIEDGGIIEMSGKNSRKGGAA